MWRLLFRWRGSIWKAVASETVPFITWVFFFTLLNVLLRSQLNETQMLHFREVRDQLRDSVSQRLPVAFLLGFFVTVVFNRWVAIFSRIGFIDSLALSLALVVHPGINNCGDGEAEKAKRLKECLSLKRTIIRYVVTAQALVFRDISLQVRLRFPHPDSLVKAGLLTPAELEIYQRRSSSAHSNANYWVPIQWAMHLASKARDRQLICSDIIMWNLAEKIRLFREDLEFLCTCDWVPVPIAYPQIVFLAVRLYTLLQLVASQGLPIDDLNLYVPLMISLELFLLVGWMKVAESLLNPFGIEDDHFECNYILERNLSTGMDIVELSNECPPPPEVLDPFSAAMSHTHFLDHQEGAVKKRGRLHSFIKGRHHRPYQGSVVDVEVDEEEEEEEGDAIGNGSDMPKGVTIDQQPSPN